MNIFVESHLMTFILKNQCYNLVTLFGSGGEKGAVWVKR